MAKWKVSGAPGTKPLTIQADHFTHESEGKLLVFYGEDKHRVAVFAVAPGLSAWREDVGKTAD